LHLELEVDGNVSWENMPKMFASGACVFVGESSSLFERGGSLRANIRRLKSIREEASRGLTDYSDWRMRMADLRRIAQDPRVMGEKPCIRGLRVTVGTIVGLLASGHAQDERPEDYPYLEQDDIQAALAYAAWRFEEVEIPLSGL
jgi:uncharacterized protein (DUF433 family)